MGAPVAYNVFAGLGELVGGLLLTVRRIAVLGALIDTQAHTALNFLSLGIKKLTGLLFPLRRRFRDGAWICLHCGAAVGRSAGEQG